MDPKAETARIIRHLRDVVKGSDLANREIEERLGLDEGSLTEILGGRDLMYGQLIALLEVLGYSQGRFFAELFPQGRDETASDGASDVTVN